MALSMTPLRDALKKAIFCLEHVGCCYLENAWRVSCQCVAEIGRAALSSTPGDYCDTDETAEWLRREEATPGPTEDIRQRARRSMAERETAQEIPCECEHCRACEGTGLEYLYLGDVSNPCGYSTCHLCDGTGVNVDNCALHHAGESRG